jgi:[glutamine synthetase] adenylyltransferase / [glutamine synthetase]-adenylyl-L-tyrosine phosphorylase
MQAEFGNLSSRLRETPLDDESGSGRYALERVLSALKTAAGDEKVSGSGAGADFSERSSAFLRGVFAGSSFLFGLAERYPRWLVAMLSTPPESHFAGILSRTAQAAAGAAGTRDIMRILRKGRSELALLVALADLGGVWTVEEVTRRLSEAADLFVSLAVRFLLTRAAHAGQFRPRGGEAAGEESGLIVFGMGKFGARELNYSSDIDLIVFFNREITPLAPHIEPAAFFVRLTRDLVHILQERTADGYVFRTDLRLRPDPGSTQVAISTEAAFRYYESLGQNWERAALIKARPVAGDAKAAKAFLDALSPYIWRKYLDYNAIADIHAMKRQIHAVKGHERIAVAGHNLKLGRGGIREIEFFVQSQQLIAGGRQPALRAPQTLSALDRLTDFDWIGPKVRDELTEAYRYLRRMEHRLQMMADQQTHTLPSSAEDLARFARFAGYSHLLDFERDLRGHMQNVQTHYAALFESVPELTPQRVSGNLVFTGDTDDPATAETLGKLGFKNPSAAIAAIKSWHYGRYPAMRSPRAREILTEFTPALLEALGDTGDPDLALATFDKFLSDVPTALQLFSLLRANPGLLNLIAQIMGSAPRLARLLSRRRRLMDAILDPGYLGARPSDDELRTLVRRQIMEAGTYEDRLNQARVVGQEQAFSIGVQLLSRQLAPREAGEAYSLLAATLIETLLDAVQASYGGEFPPPAVIAMGKLGGGEMTAASDVDLIVVYDAPPKSTSQASQHYARVTQRLISAISAPTAQGQLYPVDMRLRPSGKSGPVAVRLDGFLSYQRDQAWTWEHLALTRARPIAGPAALRERLGAQIREVLTLPRNRSKTAADVREMRAMIQKEKGTRDLWHTRNYKGGLVDAEFIAQFLQIVHAAEEPAGLSQNTEQALRNLIGAGLLTGGDGDTLLRATDLYRDIAHILRLCTDGRFDPAAAPRDLIDLLLETTGEPDIARLEARLSETYSEVAHLFATLVT